MGLVLLIFLGCRGATSVQVDVLEQELRQQEDYIYELEDYLVEYSEKLRRARCTSVSKSDRGAEKNNSSTKLTEPEILFDDDSNDLPDDILNQASPIPPQPETEDNSEPATPSQEAQPTETQQLPTPDDFHEFEIPELEIEDPNATHPSRLPLPWSISDTENGTSKAEQITTSSSPTAIPSPASYRPISEQPLGDPLEYHVLPAIAENEDPYPQVEPSAIDRIVIQQLLHNSPVRNLSESHHSQDTSRQSKTSVSSPPPSLLAVVEIRDLANEPVEAEGELSLMVMAYPASQSFASGLPNSKPQRLQRWDFSAEELAQAWQSSSLGDGLHLELPLATQSLSQESLELWARLVTVDGQKYLTKLPFHPQHLMAWQDAPLTTPEYGVSLPSESSLRLTDSTKREDTPWHLEGNHPDRPQHLSGRLQSAHHWALQSTAPVQKATQWRTAQIQPFPSGHSSTATSKSPRWVAQAGADLSRIRNLKPAPADRGTPAIMNTPTWKSIRR